MTAEEFKTESETVREASMAIALRYLRNTAIAEDIVQDTMLKLWGLCPELKSPASPLAIVLTRNACIDHLRRHRQFCKAEDIQLEDPQDGFATQEETERMMRIVDSLPGTQQIILRLRHMQGMGMKEIADMLGTNEVNVRKMLSRARKAVRDRFMKGEGI